MQTLLSPRRTVTRQRTSIPQASPRWRWGWVVLLALLAGLIVVSHGCHGDVDEELVVSG